MDSPPSQIPSACPLGDRGMGRVERLELRGTADANVQLELSNREEHLAVVHPVLVGFAEALGLDQLEAADLQGAAMEACKNVVWHAYEGACGPLTLELHANEGEVQVVVRDHGIGIRPAVGERTLPHTGIGLPIMHLASRRILYTNIPGGGTEVRMYIECLRSRALSVVDATNRPVRRSVNTAGERVELHLQPVSLVPTVLPGVLRASAGVVRLHAAALGAVRGHAAEIAAFTAEHAAAGRMRVGLSLAEHAVELELEPLRAGAARRAPAGPLRDSALSVELIRARADPAGDGEALTLRLTAER